MAETGEAQQGAGERVTLSDIRTLAGDVDEIDAAAIIATGATRAEFEEAYLYARGEGDLLSRDGRPLAGAVAEVYEILISEEDDEEAMAKGASR
jgi:hypothetical protein